MPELTRVQLILLELALACAAAGLAVGGVWLIVGVAVGAALLVLAVLPIHRRWLYQIGLSWLALLRRRAGRGGAGMQAILGGYELASVPGGSGGARIGVVRTGTTWTVPLELSLERVLNDDAGVPVERLASLLNVEDVQLSSVRLLTVTTPALRPPNAPAGPVPPAPRAAQRYCLLTFDTAMSAADALAARGGTEAAVEQIVRRCALRAEQILSTVGVSVRRLDRRAVDALFASSFGPISVRPDGSVPPNTESWHDVQMAGRWSTVFAVTGDGPDVTDRLAVLAASSPTPVVVTSLVLQRSGPHADLEATLLLRLTAPTSALGRTAVSRAVDYARALGLVLQRLDGEQGALLRATTPVGVGVGL